MFVEGMRLGWEPAGEGVKCGVWRFGLGTGGGVVFF